MGGPVKRTGTLLVIALLASVPARAQGAEQSYDKVVEASEILAFGTEAEKVEAAAVLAGLRAVYSVPILVEALGDPSAKVRVAACSALGGIKHPSAVNGLKKALGGEDEAVAVAAATALGDMHTDEAYSELVGALGKAKGGVRTAVLDGLKKWNKPFTPLPDPVLLPEGKQPPLLPGKSLPVKPKKKMIDKENPYGGSKPPAKKPAPKAKSSIDVSNPYGGSSDLPAGESSFLVLKSKKAIDKENPYAGLQPEKVELGEPDTWGSIEEEVRTYAPAVTEKVVPHLPPPSIPVELMDLTPSSFVTFETLTASLDGGDGRMVGMKIRGGYSGKHFGAGAVIPFAGGTADDNAGGFEEWVFGNLGMWIRFVGSRSFERFTLQYGGVFTMHVPSGDEVSWSHFGRDPDFLPAVTGLYATYYQHGLHYPDLEDSFKVALRPGFSIAFLVGRLAFQIELGFDFLVLGKVSDRVMEDWMRDLEDVVMFHAGLGASARPVDWLQLALELTTVVEVVGTSVRTFRFDGSEIGDPAGSEVFVTPSITALIPAGRVGSGNVTLALRVPLGEVGSSAGAHQMGPILLLSTGFRWTTP